MIAAIGRRTWHTREHAGCTSHFSEGGERLPVPLSSLVAVHNLPPRVKHASTVRIMAAGTRVPHFIAHGASNTQGCVMDPAGARLLANSEELVSEHLDLLQTVLKLFHHRRRRRRLALSSKACRYSHTTG